MAIPKLTAYALPTAAELPANKVNWAFEPERAALLIHDMQEYFLNFWGENSAMMQQVVANIARLRAYCKAHNIPVYYTAQPKEQSDEDRALLNDMWGPGLTRSPDQQRIVAELTPDEADTVLVKWRYSAFHRSPLEQMLKETGRNQLLITGVYAHIGCMTTATDYARHQAVLYRRRAGGFHPRRAPDVPQLRCRAFRPRGDDRRAAAVHSGIENGAARADPAAAGRVR